MRVESPERALAPIAALALLATACLPRDLPTPGPAAEAWTLPAVVNDDGRGVVQFDPALTIDPAGTLHATWLDFRDGPGEFGLYYARRAAGAEEWDANLRVSDLVGPVCRDDDDIAIDTAGNAHVVWSDYRGIDPDVFMSTLAAGGSAWGAPRRVNDDATDNIQWSPAIAADPRGGVVVVWSDYRDGQSDIYARVRAADGTWAPSRRVNDVAEGVQERPAVAAAPNGDVFVAWGDARRDPGDIYVARRGADAAGWEPAVRLNRDAGASRQADPTLGVDRAGVVTAAWHDDRGGRGAIWAARLAPLAVGGYDDDWGADERLTAAGAREADRPAAAGGPAGTSLVVWYEADGLAGQLWGAAWRGDRWGAPARIDDSVVAGGSRNPAAVIDGAGRGHVLWYGDDRDRQKEVFYAVGDVAPPGGAAIDITGRLEYRARAGGDVGGDIADEDPGESGEVAAAADACVAGGFVVVTCGGQVSPVLSPDDSAVLDTWDAMLGLPVRVRGRRIDGGCPRLVDVDIATAEPLACFTSSGMVAGRVGVPPLASPAGATVALDDGGAAAVDTAVGADGRFFFRDVAPGEHTLAAHARCGLTASTGVTVVPGGLARVPNVRLRLGDVVPDCNIDGRDLGTVVERYGTSAPFDPPCADVNGDGGVDLFDVVTVAVNQATVCPAPWEGFAMAAAERAEALANSGPSPELRLQSAPGLSSDGALHAYDDEGADINLIDVPLTVSGARDLYGFALTVRFDPAATPIVDADPTAPGVQAAELHGLTVIANRVDAARGEAHIAATLIAPQPPLSGDVTLATMRFEAAEGRAGRRPRVTGMLLSDVRGMPMDFELDVEGLMVATAYHLWMPALPGD